MDAETTKFLDGVIGAVEASSYEYICLWLEYAEKQKMEWNPNNSGLFITVGQVYKRPVCISLRTAVIKGHKVLFWEATSQMVDHRMIDKWFQENIPKSGWQPSGAFPNRADAGNFHNIFRYEEEKTRKSA